MGMFDTPSGTSPVDLDFEKQGNEVQGADNAQGDAQQQAQAEGQAQAQAQQAQDGQVAPEQGNAEEQLILGKYKSVDDLVKAHEALQKRLGDMRNELGNLRKASQSRQQPQVQQGQQNTEQPQGWTEQQWQQFDQHMEQAYRQNGWKAVWDLVVDAVQQAVNPIYGHFQSQEQASVREQIIDSELSLLLDAVDESGQPVFPDATALQEQIDDFLERHPNFLNLLAQQGFQRAQGQLNEGHLGALEILYNAVKAEAATAIGKQAFNNGLQQGTQQAMAKMGAAIPKAGAKQQNTAASQEEQVINEIFAHKKGGFFG
jgi:hypothetical protein